MSNSFEDRKKLYKLLDQMALACGRMKFTDDEAKEYFRHLCHYSFDAVAQAIDNLVVEAKPGYDGFRNAPTVGEIIAEIKSIQADKATSIIPEWCPTCNSTGMVVIETRDAQPMVYRCSCKNGQRTCRGIRSWDEVKSKFEAPEGVFPPKLPLVTLDLIKTMSVDAVFENGCEVSKICGTCGGVYMFRHERRMTKRDLVEFHLGELPAECEPCFVERGKKQGAWT